MNALIQLFLVGIAQALPEGDLPALIGEVEADDGDDEDIDDFGSNMGDSQSDDDAESDSADAKAQTHQPTSTEIAAENQLDLV